MHTRVHGVLTLKFKNLTYVASKVLGLKKLLKFCKSFCKLCSYEQFSLVKIRLITG